MTTIARQRAASTARKHFEQGGRVLVSVCGRREFTCGPLTTWHTRKTTTWDDLAAVVESYGDPAQRYYVVNDELTADESVKARELGTIAYNLGHPNTPIQFRGMLDLIGLDADLDSERARTLVAHFEAAWEDNADHDRQRDADLHAARMATEGTPEHTAAYGEPEHTAEDPAQLLAEYDAWRDERADLSAAEDDGGADWSESDDKGCDLASRLADALRTVTGRPASPVARSYCVGLPVVVHVHQDGSVSYDVDTAEAEVTAAEDTAAITADLDAIRLDHERRHTA